MREAADSKIRVLVVDDDLRTVQLLSAMLLQSGHDVLSTTSGAEAVDLVRIHEPNVILLDIVMPDVTGLEVLNRVRSFSRTPVIIFSGHPQITQLALKIGADDCISKPVDAVLLAKKIKKLAGCNGDGHREAAPATIK